MVFVDLITKGGATVSFNDSGFGESPRQGHGGNRGYGGGRRFGGGGQRFGGGRRFDDRPKPVETGKEYDVSITEISRKGDGIARVEGFVIFVKGGQVGQNAKVKITQVGERFATADLVGEGTAQTETE
ncbi:MAG: TRAM domain-containing protein [Thaumarchaeota archaeon]|nr:TRAM domain-containing protein [Nitrososphaerota archaeon]MDE1873348.1 TRAM domain-containing protein [Nitrososphaerota archaeon]